MNEASAGENFEEKDAMIVDIIRPSAGVREKKESIPYMWRSCSGCRIDPRILGFFSSFFISILIIVFSIIKISLSESCEETNTFMALLMFVLGVWMPHPTVS